MHRLSTATTPFKLPVLTVRNSSLSMKERRQRTTQAAKTSSPFLVSTIDTTPYLPYNKQVANKPLMQEEEYLTRCVVDPIRKTVLLLGSEGDEKLVQCDSIDEFMRVLEYVRGMCDEDTLAYTNPL